LEGENNRSRLVLAPSSQPGESQTHRESEGLRAALPFDKQNSTNAQKPDDQQGLSKPTAKNKKKRLHKRQIRG
jgi:hypothetical protein